MRQLALDSPDGSDGKTSAAPTSAKRIVICVDGTLNAEQSNTNVWRISNMIPSRGEDGVEQVVIYQRGVGLKTNSFTDIANVGDVALGANIEDYILRAYRALAAIYCVGDDIFMFGFSRGAYICQELADMISELGILAPHAPITPELLYRFTKFGDPLRKVSDYFGKTDDELKAMEFNERFVAENLRNFSSVCRVKYMGIFDTVGAIAYKSKGHFRMYPSKSIMRGRHAIGIDERRKTFVPDVWVRPADAAEPESEFDFEQRWFCGSHSNIGGGYDFDYLPQFALHWVMQGAIREGLAFLQITPLTGADCCDCPVRHELNESTNVFGEALSKTDEVFAKFFGNVKGWDHRVIGGEITRGTDQLRLLGETIDASVLYKMYYDSGYNPAEMLKWMKDMSMSTQETAICTRRASNGLPRTARAVSVWQCEEIRAGSAPNSRGPANKHDKPSFWATILRKSPGK
ncbi:T6SS Phospholipase effector Tle1-like catalytic domain-containing protein [Plasmodiophora brassicae]